MARVGTRQKGHYCTRACAFAHPEGWRRPKAIKPPNRPCKECRQETPTRRAWYCGDRCRKASESRKAKDRERAAHEKAAKSYDCQECGAKFSPVYGNQQRAFCSDICTARGKRTASRRSKRLVGSNHRQRARHYGVEYEPVNRNTIYARDAWKCGICGEKINKKLSFPHYMSASLDHIVPLSKGGGHTYANTQAAHFICNSLKSDGSAGEQLRLVG